LIADRQSAGRGRMGRQWQSPVGNFYGSTLIDVRDGDPPPATLSFVVALALFESFAQFVDKSTLQLKWPNDVLALGADGVWAKISGILLERRNGQVVLGIGANLAHYPPGFDRPVTSIANLGSPVPSRDDFLACLIVKLAHWLAVWRTVGLGPVCAAWVTNAHPAGTALSLTLPDEETLKGAFDGLDPDGALRLRLADGQVRVIHAGDVFLV